MLRRTLLKSTVLAGAFANRALAAGIGSFPSNVDCTLPADYQPPAPPVGPGPPAPTLNLVAVGPYSVHTEAVVNGNPTKPYTIRYQQLESGQWVDCAGGPAYHLHHIWPGMMATAPQLRAILIDGTGAASVPSNVLTPAIPRYDAIQLFLTGGTRGDRILLQPVAGRPGPAGTFTTADASGTRLATLVNATQFQTGTITYSLVIGNWTSGNTGVPSAYSGVGISGNNLNLVTGLAGSTSFIGYNVYYIMLFVNGVAKFCQPIDLWCYIANSTIVAPLWFGGPAPGLSGSNQTAPLWYAPSGQLATATGNISGTTLNITGNLSGNVAVGQAVAGSGVTPGTVITALTLTGHGDTGAYSINNSQTVGSTALSLGAPIILPDNYPIGGLIDLYLADWTPVGGGGNGWYVVPNSGQSTTGTVSRYRVECFDAGGAVVDLVDHGAIEDSNPHYILNNSPPAGASTYTVKVWGNCANVQNRTSGNTIPGGATASLKFLPHAGSITVTPVTGVHNGFAPGNAVAAFSVIGLGSNPSVNYYPDTSCISGVGKFAVSQTGAAGSLVLAQSNKKTTNIAAGLNAGIEVGWIVANNATNAVAVRVAFPVARAPVTAADKFIIGNTRTPGGQVFTSFAGVRNAVYGRLAQWSAGTAINGIEVTVDPYVGTNPRLENDSAYDVDTSGITYGNWACPVDFINSQGDNATTAVVIESPCFYANNGRCVLGATFDMRIRGGFNFNRVDCNAGENNFCSILPGGNTTGSSLVSGSIWLNNTAFTNYRGDALVAGSLAGRFFMSNCHMENGGLPGASAYNIYLDIFLSTIISNSNSIRSLGHQIKDRGLDNLFAGCSVMALQYSGDANVISMGSAGRWTLLNMVLQNGLNNTNTQLNFYAENQTNWPDQALTIIGCQYVQDLNSIGSKLQDTAYWGSHARIAVQNFSGISWWCSNATNYAANAFMQATPDNGVAKANIPFPNYGALTFDVTRLAQRPQNKPPQRTTFAPIVSEFTLNDQGDDKSGYQYMTLVNFDLVHNDIYTPVGLADNPAGDEWQMLANIPDGTVVATARWQPSTLQVNVKSAAGVAAGTGTIPVNFEAGGLAANTTVPWQLSGPKTVSANGIPSGATGLVSAGNLVLQGGKVTTAAMPNLAPIYLTLPAGNIAWSIGAITGGTGAWVSINSSSGALTIHNNGSTIKVPAPGDAGGGFGTFTLAAGYPTGQAASAFKFLVMGVNSLTASIAPRRRYADSIHRRGLVGHLFG